MINEVPITEPEKWDSIARSFKEHDVYYLSGYVKAFQLIGDGEPVLFYYEDNATRAMNVVMKRDISQDMHFTKRLRKGEYFDLATPYGYGGFIIETDQEYAQSVIEMNAAYSDYCAGHHIVSEFVRYHPVLSNYIYTNALYENIFLGHTVCLDTSSEETIWNNFSSKNRNVIRKAQKSGLSVYWGRDQRIIPEFLDLYKETMDRDRARSYYYFSEAFYTSILEDLKYNAMWFRSELDGETAAIAIFLFCNKNMHYHLSASKRELQSLAPSNLLLYEAALWACRNGYSSLHLGGGLASRNDGLYSFKKAFNRTPDCEFHIGRKIFMPDIYKALCDMRKQDPDYDHDEAFFPAYRA